MRDPLKSPVVDAGSRRERGAAIIIALMVSLVLAFLGLGLLLQTSLGLQAAGTDRWVARALYAADAGALAEIATLSSGAVGDGSFILTDDAGLPGMLAGQYNVTVGSVCELQNTSPALNPETGEFYGAEWRTRHVFFRSSAERNVNVLVGMTQASITQDIKIGPINKDYLQQSNYCAMDN